MPTPDDIRNEDWLRTMGWDLPTDLDGFLNACGRTAEQVRHFLTLPAAEAMPPALRVQVQHWLERPEPPVG